jgi:hypothetical protein
MKLVLHIGTEKTATTTLQHFLYHNRKALLKQRIALLDGVGIPNNRMLPAFCQPEDMFDNFFRQRKINSVAEKNRFFLGFSQKLESEILKAKKHADTLIITSEHFHSRLRGPASIQRLYDLISPYFDAIEICCYFREQSSLAFGAYSTSIVSGNDKDFEVHLKKVTPENHYYNYDALLTKWATVFGRENLRPLLYGAQHFHEGDIRRDFLRVVKEDINCDPLYFNISDLNKILGLVGLKLAQINNTLNPRYLKDGRTNKLRKAIFSSIKDSSVSSLGEIFFPQASDIYRAFENSNVDFANKFLACEGNPFPDPAHTAEKNPSEIKLNLEQVLELATNLISCLSDKSILRGKHRANYLRSPETKNGRQKDSKDMPWLQKLMASIIKEFNPHKTASRSFGNQKSNNISDRNRVPRKNIQSHHHGNTTNKELKLVSILDSKIGYYPIPKVACTTVKSLLYKIENQVSFDPEKEGSHIHRYFRKRKNKWHCGPFKFSFIILRDPIKRFLSAYSNRVIHHKNTSPWYIKSKFPDFYEELPYFNPDLRQFIGDIEHYQKIPIIAHHINPVSLSLTKSKLQNFSKIYCIENIFSLERDLTELIGSDVKLDKLQTGGPKLQLTDLSRDQMEILIDYYKEDYKLLSGFYTTGAIWDEWSKGKDV